VSATGKTINITVTVVLAAGVTLQTVYDNFMVTVEDYLKDIGFESTYVSHAKIGTLLLGITGVNDYANLKLNGVAANVDLATEEIPVLGSIDLEV
jgi:uncharacterized phage protein gp47/JayE